MFWKNNQMKRKRPIDRLVGRQNYPGHDLKKFVRIELHIENCHFFLIVYKKTELLL